ncbi:putative NADP-dependent oxidoreductase domain-containing protein [Seiridium unicorne]|uniref:NADP-dependent oxidoreductase domain-containing protein n=1 Tax=Seiridium unicorne TaxID=138068 RepID=A0ABR2URE5_9PEZI
MAQNMRGEWRSCGQLFETGIDALPNVHQYHSRDYSKRNSAKACNNCPFHFTLHFHLLGQQHPYLSPGELYEYSNNLPILVSGLIGPISGHDFIQDNFRVEIHRGNHRIMAAQSTPEPPTELGRHRIFSSTAAIRVSPLQLGGMSIGDAWSGFLGSMDKESSFKLLDAYWEAGGNIIDTSNNYQDEQSETWIGEWMKERNNRDSIVVATKFTTDYRSHAIGKGPQAANFSGNHRKVIHMSVRDSLRKLQTDYIDILYIHWWDQTTSIKELMDTLHFLVEQGKVLYLGVSDTPAWIVAAANTYAADHGKTPFSVYQGRWNVMNRAFERDIIPMARHFGMALAPWDVLGGGKFQTKASIEKRKEASEPLRLLSGAYQTPEEVRMSAALAKVASEHGIESVTAIALAYVLHKAPNVFPIVGGRKVEHLKDNLQALSIKLTEKQIAQLENARPFHLGFPHDFIGPDPYITGKSNWLARTSHVVFPNAQKLKSV